MQSMPTRPGALCVAKPMLDFGVVMDAVLFALGAVWCREMFGRWRRDLAEYRSGAGPGGRKAIVVLWIATALIVVLMINFGLGLLRNLGAL